MGAPRPSFRRWSLFTFFSPKSGKSTRKKTPVVYRSDVVSGDEEHDASHADGDTAAQDAPNISWFTRLRLALRQTMIS